MSRTEISLAERTIVVAGAGGGGIGTAVASTLRAAGARVVGLDIDPERLAMAEVDVARVADVRDTTSVEAALRDVGPLDGLVYVAGGLRVDQWAPTERLALESFDDVLALNLRGALSTSQVVAAELVPAARRGTIVYIASIAALHGMPYGAAYAVAKAGVLALTRTQAVEWGRAGIRVNAIAAGTTRTPKSESENASNRPEDMATIPLGRRGDPSEIADAVLFLCSDLASFITGHVLVVDGGASVKPSYVDADNLPVFVRDSEMRARITGVTS
jgi:NAD(P)-dependent dehydrogenase (short-subunit alcohol dehydrogenase family)